MILKTKGEAVLRIGDSNVQIFTNRQRKMRNGRNPNMKTLDEVGLVESLFDIQGDRKSGTRKQLRQLAAEQRPLLEHRNANGLRRI